MKLLVATTETQGQRENDFCWATEGEIVDFGSECDGESVDGPCGCRRGMIGIESHKTTTTMKVVDRLDVDADSLAATILAGQIDAGWVKVSGAAAALGYAHQEAQYLIDTAAQFDVGDIVERRGNILATRV